MSKTPDTLERRHRRNLGYVPPICKQVRGELFAKIFKRDLSANQVLCKVYSVFPVFSFVRAEGARRAHDTLTQLIAL